MTDRPSEFPMFQATRRRLALWYTLVTAVLLLLFASGFYFYARNTLIERVDDTLKHVVEVVQRSLVIEAQPPRAMDVTFQVNVEASFRDNAATREDDHIDLEWFSPTGELRWSTFAEPLQLPLHAQGSETVEVPRDRPSTEEPLILRQVTHQVEFNHQLLGYLRVSHPWFEVSKPTRQLILDLSLWTVLMVGAVAAIGWLLSELAMEPVRDSYQRLRQFTADASHELRSPIAVIQTNVQVALADPNPTRQQRQLQVIERLTRRLGRLVDDLLFLARQDSGIVQPRWATVDLGRLLKEVVEEQQFLAQEQAIALSLHLPAGDLAEPLTLRGDRDQLARLFTNLVGNALQYTPKAGTVEVRLERQGRSQSPQLQITVTDTGPGIPAAALPHLFDRFYRVDPARAAATNGGSGLGLAIAQAIVETHRGQIAIASPSQTGTTVTVTLPQSKPEN